MFSGQKLYDIYRTSKGYSGSSGSLNMEVIYFPLKIFIFSSIEK